MIMNKFKQGEAVEVLGFHWQEAEYLCSDDRDGKHGHWVEMLDVSGVPIFKEDESIRKKLPRKEKPYQPEIESEQKLKKCFDRIIEIAVSKEDSRDFKQVYADSIFLLNTSNYLSMLSKNQETLSDLLKSAYDYKQRAES